MKLYKKYIKPMLSFPGKKGKFKSVPVESTGKWYPEEELGQLVEKYKTKVEFLFFKEKFEEQKTSGAWEFVFHNPSYSPFDDSPGSLYKCTNCGYTTGSTTKYCPVCGSKNQP